MYFCIWYYKKKSPLQAKCRIDITGALTQQRRLILSELIPKLADRITHHTKCRVLNKNQKNPPMYSPTIQYHLPILTIWLPMVHIIPMVTYGYLWLLLTSINHMIIPYFNYITQLVNLRGNLCTTDLVPQTWHMDISLMRCSHRPFWCRAIMAMGQHPSGQHSARESIDKVLVGRSLEPLPSFSVFFLLISLIKHSARKPKHLPTNDVSSKAVGI